ncbi:hypothetical protein MRY82_04930 [bacterium]|nr:hypothetical protein [bacterium]
MSKNYLKLRSKQNCWTSIFQFLSLLVLALMFNLACTGKKPNGVDIPQDNTLERMYKESPDFVFKKLQEVLDKKFNFTFDFIDQEKYILSTSQVREQSIHGPRKYRVNASVHTDRETGASTLRLYKQEKVFQNNQWQDVRSDQVLEESIFEALKH